MDNMSTVCEVRLSEVIEFSDTANAVFSIKDSLKLRKGEVPTLQYTRKTIAVSATAGAGSKLRITIYPCFPRGRLPRS